MLAEKKLDFQLIFEPTWKRREEFFDLNPAGQVPVLMDLNQKIICDSMVICEYLDEAYPEFPLIRGDVFERAEIRRLTYWFDDKFGREVSRPLVFEKTLKRFFSGDGPDSNAMRHGKSALSHHLDYISWLADRRNWLAGDHLTLADLTAAAHLSLVDYVGSVPWDAFPEAKEWYSRLKSRPSFRPLLSDAMVGIAPAVHYTNLDF